MKIEKMETSKEAIKAYLEDAAASRKCEIQSGKAMRLAVFRFIADMVGLTEQAERNEAWKQFNATPGWFGCNASAARQALEIKAEGAKVVEEIEA